ncbi:MFS transporter [Streptomyces sp. NPDC001868]|uniref:MFS transporter n=1 Tax=Streptomyces sp. NPDC001868 TaxID=3154401 RepID=UPI00331AC1F7
MPGSLSLPASPPASASGAPPADRGRLRAALLMAGSCLPVLGAVLIAPVLPRMQDHFASVPGAEVLVPVVLTVPALALALLAPFAGVVVDRLGRKRLLVVATALYAVFGTAPLWLDSLGAIVASRVLVGVVEGAIMTCCTTLIGDYYTGRTRERYLALQTVCASASATAFFVIGGALGSAGWRAPFWIYAVGLLLAPVMATVLPKPRPGAGDEGRAPATTQAADGAHGTPTAHGTGALHGQTDKAPGPDPAIGPDPAVGPDTTAGAGELPLQARPFPLRRLAGICLLTVFGGMVFYTVPVETAYLLDDLGVTSTGVIGLATGLASAATVAGSLVFTRLPGTPEGRLPAVFALCAAGFVVMGLAGDPVPLIAGGILNCVGTGILLPSLLTAAMSRLDYADRGRGTGLWTAAFFAGEFVCPLVLIGVASAAGGLAAAVGLLGLASALVAAGLLLARRSVASR